MALIGYARVATADRKLALRCARRVRISLRG